MSDKKKTAVEWLRDNLHTAKDPFNQALSIEKSQHAMTWSDAIKAHEERGHNTSRSEADFDEYFSENYGK